MEPECTDARRRPERLRLLVAVLAALAACFVVVPSAALAGGQLLVYTGNGAINEGYAQFAAAAGRTQVTSSTLPSTDSQWDSYACVVVPVPTVGFTDPQRAAFNNYMSRGGTVVALAEHLNADQSQTIGPASVTALNNLAAGSGIQALNTTRNQGPFVTQNIDASTYTQGVTKVGLAATTTLTVTAPAFPLVETTQPDPMIDPAPAPFIAMRLYGAGKLVYSGDSNVFSDGGGGYYAGNDNGKLARDVCGDINPPVITITTPQDNARYRKGQVLPAAWTCVDPDSDVDTALTTATTAVGQPIDTAVPGTTTATKSFTVSCTDKVGNAATKTVHYVVDGSPPDVTITTPTDGATYDRNSIQPAAWGCSDADGPLDIDTTLTVATKPVGDAIDTVMPLGGAPIPKSFTVTCTDKAGNTATKTVNYTVADQNPPVANITSPLDAARYRVGQVVNAAWACTDPDGPQDIDQAASFGSLPVGDPIDTGTTGSKSFSVHCQDLAGNSGDKTVSYVVDGSPPIITIAVPTDGGTYPRGSSQPANWGCTDADGDTDVKTKVGTVPVGTPINTSTLGVKTFTVTCTDQAGNSSTKTVSYTVIGGPPTVNIVSPVDGKTYDQGVVIPPTYSCADADNDLKSCIRQGGSGAIDTSKGGTFAFTVDAEDLAGNKATKTVHYTIKPKAGSAPSTAVSPSTTKTTKVCTSRRQFRIRVKKLKGGVKAVSATVFVNGKKTLTRKGKRVTATVTLKGLKKGRYTVKINVKYSNGRVLSYTRKFKTCTPKGK